MKDMFRMLSVVCLVIAIGIAASIGLVQKAKRLDRQDQANEAIIAQAATPAKPDELAQLREQVNNLRWDMDDLRIQCRTEEELAFAKKISPNDPWNTVEVSHDYPKIRLPYGVKVVDERPKEIQDAARAKGEMLYMWLEVPLENGRERRVYFPKIEWRGDK